MNSPPQTTATRPSTETAAPSGPKSQVLLQSKPQGPSQNKPQGQKSDNFTRSERRAYGKQKKAAQPNQRGRVEKPAHRKQPQAADLAYIDATIAQLQAMKQQQLQGGRKSQAPRPGANSLASRITRDAPKKKELSPQKLEKIQKRKEILAEKRKAFLAKKAEQQAQQGEPQVSQQNTETQIEQTTETLVQETTETKTKEGAEAKAEEKSETKVAQSIKTKAEEKSQTEAEQSVETEVEKTTETKVDSSKTQQKEAADFNEADFDGIDWDDE